MAISTISDRTAVTYPGAVLQVVQGITYTQVASSSTSFADTGLSATITPTASTSKILVLVTHPEVYKTASGSVANSMKINLCRNGAQLTQFNVALLYTGTAIENQVSSAFNYLDSPATTSAVTYKTQFANLVAAAQVLIQSNGTPSTITLMEIAA